MSERRRYTLAPRVCEQCGHKAAPDAIIDTMITMAPGPDGEAWWLCSPCYRMGIGPQKVGNFKTVDELTEKEPA